MPCYIFAHTGKKIGAIVVPAQWMGISKCQTGEFILLSTQTKNTELEEARKDLLGLTAKSSPDDTKDRSIYNIMLIDWKDGLQFRVAIRVNIAEIKKVDWLQATVEQKTIILN